MNGWIPKSPESRFLKKIAVRLITQEGVMSVDLSAAYENSPWLLLVEPSCFVMPKKIRKTWCGYVFSGVHIRPWTLETPTCRSQWTLLLRCFCAKKDFRSNRRRSKEYNLINLMNWSFKRELLTLGRTLQHVTVDTRTLGTFYQVGSFFSFYGNKQDWFGKNNSQYKLKLLGCTQIEELNTVFLKGMSNVLQHGLAISRRCPCWQTISTAGKYLESQERVLNVHHLKTTYSFFFVNWKKNSSMELEGIISIFAEIVLGAGKTASTVRISVSVLNFRLSFPQFQCCRLRITAKC